MSDLSKNFFSKVDTRSERQRAYSLLVDSKEEIQIQLANKELIRAKGLNLRDNYVFLQIETIPDIQDKEEVVVTFGLGKEKYFLKTTIMKNMREQYYIDIDPALFKLQRRGSFRVLIPVGYNARVHLEKINDNELNVVIALADLSAGGFAFETNSQFSLNIQRSNILKGNVVVGGKFNKPFEAIVRHVGNIGSKGSGLRRYGLEFINLSLPDQESYMKITMELHRDMFSTFKIGSR